MSAAAPVLLCFGLGYSARVLARRLAGDGWMVRGTSRDAVPDLLQFDWTHPLPPAAFAGVTHVLVSVPPDEEGDPVLDTHADDIAALSALKWVG